MNISLVIPAYNEEKTLAECLTHIVANPNNHFSEIIVVDNGSTDATPTIAKKFPQVSVVFELRKGVTSARNKGFEVSKGDIIAFIDADCSMPRKWCKTIEQLFQNPIVGCVSGPYSYNDAEPLIRSLWRISFGISYVFHVVTGSIVIGGNFAIRRTVLTKMNGFDQNLGLYGEDVNTGRRAHEFGRVIYTSKLKMPTSSRRIDQEGALIVWFKYVITYVSEIFFKRSIIKNYKDYR